MKKMRRIASLLLAMVMAFGLTATAFAAEVDNQTEHSYAAYQVFSGTQQESVGEGDGSITALGDIEWGSGVNGEALLIELNALAVEGATPFADCKSAADVAAVLDGETDYDSAIAKAFANAADKHRINVFTEIPAGAASVQLDTGYYLLVDTGNPDGSSIDAYNSALLQITNQKITIKKKYDVPTVDKAVKDKVDGEAGEAVDVNIGDSVYFVLTGTLPENLGDYETYKYAFTDELSAGLKYNGNAGAKVYLFKDGDTGNGADGNKVDITGSFTITHTAAVPANPAGGGGTLEVSIDDLKGVEGVSAGGAIVVEYSAELTADAVTGGNGNDNTVKLTYSNNPNADASGDPSEDTGETPEDKTIVFTYKLDGTKVDGTNTDKTLKDAKFVLFRLKKGETEPSYTEMDGKKIPTNVEYALVIGGKLEGWTENRETAIGTNGNGEGILVSDGNGLFGVSGLDAGTYYLEETKAPAGYNLLEKPVKLTIQAEISQGDDEAKEDPSLTQVEIVTLDKDGQEAPTEGDKTDGSVDLVVQNNAGALLPSTGGMGTTLFYIVGAALVLAAGVLFMMKRRTDSGK